MPQRPLIPHTMHHTFTLNSEYIELDKLLKLLSIAHSGGAAKAMVADGMVRVDGALETRKTRKLRAGSVVEVLDETIRIVGDAADA
ncbi:ribosome-associated protein YbcJ [Uliginosibacterium sediminicola]